MQDGHRYIGTAVTTAHKVVWEEALPADTSAQRAELIALTKALRLRKGKRINVYMDIRYAFAT